MAQYKKVLLVDDDEDDRAFFLESMKSIDQNVICVSAQNGREALQTLLADDQKPDIIFLDLNMPLKSGLDCLKEIRAHPHWKELSVAIYSTSSSEEDIENTFVQGANVYIKKPHEFNRLVKVLSEVIKINWQYHTSGLNKDNFVMRI